MKNLLLVAAMLAIFSCTKEIIKPISKENRDNSLIEVDDFAPIPGFNLYKKPITPELKRASERAAEIGKAIGKGRNKPKPPRGDTTKPPPPPPPTDTNTYTGDYVFFYDFDGEENFSHPSWHTGIKLEPSGLTEEGIAKTLSAAMKAYEPYNILVTADSTEFYKRPVGKRMRIYVTQTWEVYGRAGGAAYTGSLFWTNDTPCFVFSGLLSYNAKWISDAMVHEPGHTIGLRHQADWKNGIMTSGYSSGFTPDHAPHMGISYYDLDGGEFFNANTTDVLVTNGETREIKTSSYLDQNDHEIILSKVGARK